MTIARDDHHQVVAASGVRREADPEKSADGDAVLVLEDGLPGFGRGYHGGREESVPQSLFVGGELR